MTETPVHDQAGHDAITAELVRLTLGHRGPQRLELDVIAAELLEQMRRNIEAVQLELGRRLLPPLQAIARFITDNPIPWFRGDR